MIQYQPPIQNPFRVLYIDHPTEGARMTWDGAVIMALAKVAELGEWETYLAGTMDPFEKSPRWVRVMFNGAIRRRFEARSSSV